MSLRVGVDLVRISRMAESLSSFGGRFAARFFTADEIAYAESAPDLAAERLAARFAAKEAVVKALSLTSEGLDLRQIEVRKLPSGGCELALHGEVAAAAARLSVKELSMSLSHEGDQAIAFVVASVEPEPSSLKAGEAGETTERALANENASTSAATASSESGF